MEGAFWNETRRKGSKWKLLKLRSQNRNTPKLKGTKIDFSLIFRIILRWIYKIIWLLLIVFFMLYTWQKLCNYIEQWVVTLDWVSYNQKHSHTTITYITLNTNSGRYHTPKNIVKMVYRSCWCKSSVLHKCRDGSSCCINEEYCL